MQDKMECDWFKPSTHEVIHCDDTKTFNSKIRNKNLNLKSTNPTKSRNKNNCVFDT